MNTLLLIVDDEPDILSLISLLLTESGFEIATANRAESAIELFNSLPRRPDLVLTDVVMPGMSGPMLIDRLGAVDPELRVLFMSGYDDRQVVQRYVVQQGYSLITKPFTHSGLQAAIQKALAGPATSGVTRS